jgi:hypothetical protein
MPFEMDRAFYARMYGPSVGDRVRLGDTNLLVEVERDEASPRLSVGRVARCPYPAAPERLGRSGASPRNRYPRPY